MKYLALYKKWAKKGYIPIEGLCEYFMHDGVFDRDFDIMQPDFRGGYWGYDGSTIWEEDIPINKWNEVTRQFTPLRQNIVLFMAAMNNEL